MRNEMGKEALYFSNFNPNGKYKLDLENPVQRDILKSMILINRKVNAKIVAKECADRS
jgi:hypothetical protein